MERYVQDRIPFLEGERPMKIADYSETLPAFVPEEFFVGRLEGWAVLEGPLGGLQRRASIKAQGSFDASSRVTSFTETWTFDDGQVDTLRWSIQGLDDGRYSGTEPTLEGEAEGERAGCAFHWTYTRNVPGKDGDQTKLDFNDWFFRIDETGVIVKGTAGRFRHSFCDRLCDLPQTLDMPNCWFPAKALDASGAS